MLSAKLLLPLTLMTCLTQTPRVQDPDVEFNRRIALRSQSESPVNGFVPDASTAIAIATAVVAPIYGKAVVEAEKPWKAGLKDGVWTVIGTFNGRGNGGNAIVQIDQKKGTIVFVNHTS